MNDALASLIVGLSAVVGSVVVARISRPEPDPHAAPAQDLTTIAGLAAALTENRTETSRQIAELQARQLEHEAHARLQDRTIRALRRWAAALEGALRSTGATMPEPDPEDAPLIRGA